MALATVTLALQAGDGNARTRARVRRAFADRGFKAGTKRGGTGSYERQAESAPALLPAVRDFLRILEEDDAADIDHLWILVK